MPARVIESGAAYPEFSILQEQSLRVSCASFARILDQRGNYLLMVNRDKLNQGKTVLTPIGGGIEVTPAGRRSLMQQFELSESMFEDGNDLRLVVNGKHANNFRKWFLTGEGRETDPRREMREELIEETGILQSSDQMALDQAQISLVGYHSEIGLSTRSGSIGKLTYMLSEIFYVSLSEQLMRKMEQLKQNPLSPLLRFVSPDEITRGMTTDGIEIGTIAKALVHPTATLEEIK